MMIRYDRTNCRLRILLSGLLFLTALSACGFKTPPLPPDQVVPQAIDDLRYELSEKGVTLRWSYPTRTVNGTDLKEIPAFDLYRAVVPVADYCDSCPIPFGAPVVVQGGEIPPDQTRTAEYTSSLLRPGHLYFFKVRSRTGWWAQSGDSNTVSFIWYIPPAAPGGFNVTPGDSEIRLTWQPVKSLIDGAPVEQPVSYQIFRSVAGQDFQPLGDLQQGSDYVDTRVKNGTRYFYKVQSVSVYDKGSVGGGFSEIAATTPVDRTPPAPPVGVRAIMTGEGVKVFWDPVSDKDVSGYHIYRRLAGQDTFTLIGTVNVPYTLYVDRNAPSTAARVFYSVSSFDTVTPPNESTKSPEVMIRNR